MRRRISTDYLNFNLDDIKENLKSHQREEKHQALLALFYQKPENTVEMLKELIKIESDPIIKEIAVVVLSEFEFKGYNNFFLKLSKTYRETNNFVKGRALWALGKKARSEDIKIFLEGLSHESHEIQFWSAISLSKYPSTEIPLPIIENALKENKRELVKNAIIWFLGKNKNLAATKILIDILLNDSNSSVRLCCVWGLNRMDDINVIQALNLALKNELNSLVKREIALSMGLLLNIDKVQKIETLSNISLDETIKECVRTLSMVLQRDSTYFVRRACASALGFIQHNSAADVLINHMASEVNQFVRREIAVALGKLKLKKAIPVLKKARRSHYEIVAQAAAEAIMKIKKS